MRDLVAELRRRRADMLDHLEQLVSIESPSDDAAANLQCVLHAAELGEQLLGADAEHITVDGRKHLRWRVGLPKLLLIGHLDTVWPIGTLARWPFSVSNGQATGPGAFDMKAGVVQGFHALSLLESLDGVVMLLTTDEEVGSPTSRALIEESATGASAVLVLEPSAAGALKVARKGVSMYTLEAMGKASHAGLEPEKGINAAVEIAHHVLALESIERPAAGTTVTPTVVTAGTATNVVPARATLRMDIRASTPDEQVRVDEELHRRNPVVPGAQLVLHGGVNRPAFPPEASAALFARAQDLANRLGVGPIRGASVGGASDGNFTAGLSIPTLDGLGAVGDGAHAEGEHVVVDTMPERAALVAALVDDLLQRDHID